MNSRQEYDQRRRKAKPWRAWYHTPQWRAIRRAQLHSEPFCWLCEKRGILRIANVCNHVERHEGDPIKFWNGPFNSMCEPCHDSDQQRIEGGGRARAVPDADGWQID